MGKAPFCLQRQHFYPPRYPISRGFSISTMMGRWWWWKWRGWSFPFCSHCPLTSAAAVTGSLVLGKTLKHGLWPILPVLKHIKLFPPFLPVGKLLTENERLTFQKLVLSTKQSYLWWLRMAQRWFAMAQKVRQKAEGTTISQQGDTQSPTPEGKSSPVSQCRSSVAMMNISL